MLDRRFAFVCFLAMLFGLFFADLVARGAGSRSLSVQSWQASCSWLEAGTCARRPLRF